MHCPICGKNFRTRHDPTEAGIVAFQVEVADCTGCAAKLITEYHGRDGVAFVTVRAVVNGRGDKTAATPDWKALFLEAAELLEERQYDFEETMSGGVSCCRECRGGEAVGHSAACPVGRILDAARRAGLPASECDLDRLGIQEMSEQTRAMLRRIGLEPKNVPGR